MRVLKLRFFGNRACLRRDKKRDSSGQIGYWPMNGQVISNREGVSAMIMQEALPGIKRFLKSAGLKDRMQSLTIRCVAAFCLHWGRMSAVQAVGAVGTEPRQRAHICRFLGSKTLRQGR